MKKGTKKTISKKGKTAKGKSSVSAVKAHQKDYNKLMNQRKKIDEEIKKIEKIFKILGVKLKKRADKDEKQSENGEKTEKKRGRKKKEAVTVVEKSEEVKTESH